MSAVSDRTRLVNCPVACATGRRTTPGPRCLPGWAPGHGSDRVNDVCGRIGPAEQDRWTVLVRHRTAVCAQVTLPGLAPFQYRGPQVGRFSFRLLPSFTEPGSIPAAGE